MPLLSMLDELAEREPDEVVAVDADPARPVTVTREALRRRTLALRAELARAGVGGGDCVAVWLPNWSDALCWQIAVASLGAHVIGVNTRYNVDEVGHVLDRARPTVVALAHEFHGLDLIGTLRRAAGTVDGRPPRVAVVAGPHARPPAAVAEYDLGSGAWCPAGSAEDAAGPDPESTGDALAAAFTTSGSTGAPKLAAHRESAVVAHAEADARVMDVRPGDVVLCALPLSGVFGFNTAMAALAGGATCLLEPVFDAEAVLADMDRFGVTHVVGGDDLVGRLAGALRGARRALPAWRWMGIANFLGRGPELAGWALREFGVVATGLYGSSEVFALTACWPPDEPPPRRWVAGGFPVAPEIAVRAVDPESGREMAPGEQGELQFRGPNVVDAYLGDPAAAGRSFTADGWFRSGDLGVVAGDGSFEFVCRMGEALRLRGFLVDPAEIERRLAEHEAVTSAKVVGAREGGGGETRAVGFVVLSRPVEPEELRDWCAETLARFKIPDIVEVLDEMPTTSGTNGTKIRLGLLREWAQRSLDARGSAAGT